MGLESNVPIQFFDVDSEGDLQPNGFKNYQSMLSGQRRISADHSKFLDLTKPGRLHHFLSFTDVTYWQRYQEDKERHELMKGKVSTFSPISRFPKGISLLHFFATNVKLLNDVQDAIVD